MTVRERAACLLSIITTISLVVIATGIGFAADPPKAEKIMPEQMTFFESKIRPLLINNCYKCHSDQAQRGGFRIDSREAMLKGSKNGPVIIAGDPAASSLLKAVGYDGKIKMPPTGKLKPAEIAALAEWVKMGAPWPVTKAPAGVGQAPDLTITDKQKSFWSFQTFKKSPLPVVKNSTWCINPIDRFILAKLEAKGLQPAPPADRRSLIRRVTFDLIGLPPTPEEVETFVNDKSPKAWEKIVDRLLANPHYGEHWGRHWLDLVRYADSNGLDENVAFAHAYLYRDYVVNAYNKDKPYNTFIREQLAGDLMETPDENLRNERLTATGFLSLGPKVLAEPDKEKMVMDIVDEQIEVSSKAFLGLTITCARCHNHKFDPIPTKDYYALAGIFKSTKTMQTLNTVAMWQERPLMSKEAQSRQMEYQQKLKNAEETLKFAKTKAGNEILIDFRRDSDKYLQAAWELLQQGELVSLAETPAKPGDPARLFIEAEKYDRGTANRDFVTYGQSIGIIHTTVSPTIAEWDFNLPAAGTYQLEFRYASEESRPVRLTLNGQVIKTDAAGTITGSFQPEGQKWEAVGAFPFKSGKNTLRMDCDGSIPHFDKLMIVAVKQRPAGKSSLSANEIAKKYGLKPEMVKECVGLIQNLQSDPSMLSPAEFAAESSRLAMRMRVPKQADKYYIGAAKQEIAKAEEAVKTLKEVGPPIASVMAVEEGKIENARVHIRGDTQNLGDAVPRHFPSVLNGESQIVDDRHSGRLEYAEWLTKPTNPLVGRVEVNRIWQGHFGEGLVRTPDSWGLLGVPPTHPELLDWLASVFVGDSNTAENSGNKDTNVTHNSDSQWNCGWSVKKLHRLILLSNTYKMAITADAKTTDLAATADPDNLLRWKMDRRRLEAEPFRDAILSVSGKLDLTMGGTLMKTPNHGYVTNDQSGNAEQYGALRRSLYLPVIRNALFDMFQAFDMGDPSMVNAKRSTTTIAPQALFVMNSPFILGQAKALATDLLMNTKLDDAGRIRLAYLRAYSRPPTPTETARDTTFLTGYASHLISSVPDAEKRRSAAWAALCQLILASNEFIYLN